MPFSELGLSEEVVKAVSDSGYTEPTPIQTQAIPIVLMGRDILGCAQTGTGKTAGFTLPMIEILAAGRAKARMPRSLILEPTRELAAQVAEAFERYGKYHKLTMALLIGGVSMSEQIAAIDRGPDVLIATPGRLIDLFERGRLLLNDTRILVIDEADRMLDMGFIPDVEKIVSLVSRIRQTLFFSATMPPEIRRLADKFLINPKEIAVAPPASVADTVTQGMIVVPHRDGRRPGGGAKEKRAALRAMIKSEKVKNALVFCNRKRDVGIVRKSLVQHGFSADELHGDMSQPARMEALAKFKNGDFTFMVCSDVAARGLDIANMSHVFNFDVPTHPEDYVHRIGRTGRAGKEGRALTIAVPEDGKYLEQIVQLIGQDIPKLDITGIGGAELEKGDGGSSRGGRGHGRGGGRDRGRGHGRNRKKTSPGRETAKSAAENVKSAAENAKPDAPNDPKPSKPHGPKPHRERGGKGDNRGGGVPNAGMGDHAPAFLLRRPKGK